MNHGELPVSEHDLAPPPDDPELALVLAPLRRDECECEALCSCEEPPEQCDHLWLLQPWYATWRWLCWRCGEKTNVRPEEEK